MALRDFYGKHVLIAAIDGKVFYGLVDEYIFAEDNNNNEESIVLKTYSGDLIEFINSAIKNIKETD